jgi:hypothetical protein
MRDGAVHEIVMGTATHLTGDAVLDKFRMNTEAILGKERAASAIDLVQRLDKLPDVAQLLDVVTLGGADTATERAPALQVKEVVLAQ